MVGPEVAGLHPASKSAVPYVLGHFLPVPSETGWSDGDLQEQYRSASWRVTLNEAAARGGCCVYTPAEELARLERGHLQLQRLRCGHLAKSMGYKHLPTLGATIHDPASRDEYASSSAAENGAPTVSVGASDLLALDGVFRDRCR